MKCFRSVCAHEFLRFHKFGLLAYVFVIHELSLTLISLYPFCVRILFFSTDFSLGKAEK